MTRPSLDGNEAELGLHIKETVGGPLGSLQLCIPKVRYCGRQRRAGSSVCTAGHCVLWERPLRGCTHGRT